MIMLDLNGGYQHRLTEDLLADYLLTGEQDLFTEVYKRLLRYRHLLRQLLGGNWPLIEEVYQDSVVKLWKYRAQYKAKAGSTVATWFVKILFNEAYSRLRRRTAERKWKDGECKRQLRQPAGYIELDLIEAEEGRAEAVSEVDKAMGRLRVGSQECLYLRYWVGLDYEQIASREGIPIGTVRSRLNRSKQVLRRLLTDFDSRRVA
jgi:RNA polymerase sigma-70 factor (ECF subfamily)